MLCLWQGKTIRVKVACAKVKVGCCGRSSSSSLEAHAALPGLSGLVVDCAGARNFPLGSLGSKAMAPLRGFQITQSSPTLSPPLPLSPFPTPSPFTPPRTPTNNFYNK